MKIKFNSDEELLLNKKIHKFSQMNVCTDIKYKNGN